MNKDKKATIKSPIFLLFMGISLIVVYFVLRTFVFPLVSIFFNQNNSIPAIELSEEQIQNLVSIRDSWERMDFDGFSLKMPNYEELSIEGLDENSKAFRITDPESGENVSISIKKTETDIEKIDDLLPENTNGDLRYGLTLLGSYEALRIGPVEPPYDTVSYYLLENGYVYEINAVFSTPVVFLDQILSTLKIAESQ